MRFVSHLDMMRLFERALRRSGLPLRMTEGFNRRPRISFPVPLAVGWEARDEVMEFELADWVRAPEVRARLEAELPEGVEAVSVSLVAAGEKAQAVDAEFEVRAVCEECARRLTPEAVGGFLARGEWLVERTRKGRQKSVDVRPFVRAMRLENGTLTMRMALADEGTAKPEEVLRGMGFAPGEIAAGFRIVRSRVRLRGDEG